MRLHSVILRNYRIHRELSVGFDERCTLIAGPNEAGKSTLAEALHRALFLRSRTGGETQKAMLPLQHPGHPEVELEFAVGTQRFTVAKRFSGPSGTTRLTCHGGGSWQGDDAESRLAGLLQVEEVSAGRGVGERVNQQWAHLWVWQGRSGADPGPDTETQHRALVQRLQSLGGAAVNQSALDQRLAERFRQRVTELFRADGVPRRHTDLDRAMQQRDRARQHLEACEQRCQRLEQAMSTHRQTTKRLAEAEETLQRLRSEQAEVRRKQDRVAELRREEQARRAGLEQAETDLQRREEIEQGITDLRAEQRRLEESLAPRRAALEHARSEGERLAETRHRAGTELDRAGEAVRAARRQRALAEARYRELEAAAERDMLEDRARQIEQLRAQRAGLAEGLAALAPVTAGVRAELDELDRRWHQAETALASMAAGIEIIHATQPVTVAGEPLAEGEQRRLDGPAEIRVGETRLRILPGGGDALETARRTLQDARHAFDERLRAFGLDSLAQAAEVQAERADRERRIEALDGRLQGMDAEHLPVALEAARAALQAAAAERRRSAQGLDDEILADNSEAARERLAEAERALEAAEAAETACRTALEQARRECDEHAAGLERRRVELRRDEERLRDHQVLLRRELEQHGDDTARAEALVSARARRDERARALEDLHEELARLQPQLLEADADRVRRAMEQCEDQQRVDDRSRAVAAAALESEGRDDPLAALAEARAESERAEAEWRAIERRAEAVRLLDHLFREERQRLIDHYTGPLAERIGAYLQCLFGPGAGARVCWSERGLEKVELRRDVQGAALEFDRLSGGTREQVAAAVRLAVAEVLAEDHDGSLPLVFDDAFAYADPERVRTLQRMLDRAARQGLQIILLSCSPADYAGLGAPTVRLPV